MVADVVVVFTDDVMAEDKINNEVDTDVLLDELDEEEADDDDEDDAIGRDDDDATFGKDEDDVKDDDVDSGFVCIALVVILISLKSSLIPSDGTI